MPDRRLSAFLVLGLLASSTSANAQSIDPYVPLNFDLSGVWRLPSWGHPTTVGVSQCGVIPNLARWGFDHLELELAGVQRSNRFQTGETLEFIYTGTFVHRHGIFFASQSDVNAPIAFDPLCVGELLTYDVTLSLHYLEDNEPAFEYPWTLVFDAELQQAPLLLVHDDVIHYEAAFPFDDPARLRSWVYQDGAGDALNLFPPLGFGGLVNPGPPQQCDHMLGGGAPGVFFGLDTPTTSCFGVDDIEPLFYRSSNAGSPYPLGTVAGQLFDTLPDGTPTTTPVPVATVSLYRQRSRIRPQDPGESDEDYNLYILTELEESTLVATQTVEADGRFSMEVPTIYAPPGSRVVFGALYLMVVSEARREIGGGNMGTELLFYANEYVRNVRPAYDEAIHLRALDGFGAKREVIDTLSDLAPNAYGPVETAVLQDLNNLENGSPTEAQIEGVRRAVWAERVVLAGSQIAQQMLTSVMEKLAGLIADVVGGAITTGRSAARGKKKVKAADQASYDNSRRRYTGDQDRASFDRNRERIDDYRQRDPDIHRAQLARDLKVLMDWGYFRPLNAALVANGGTDELQSMFSTMRKIAFVMTDIALSFELSSSSKILIEEALKALAPQVFDNALEFAWADLNTPLLVRSRTQMNNWSISSDPGYRVDRDRVVALLREMNDLAAEATIATDSANELSGAFGDAADIFDHADFIPAVKTAKNASELSKIASDITALLVPAHVALIEMPLMIDDGVNFAYGMQPNRAYDGERTGPWIPVSTAPTEDLDEALDAAGMETLPMIRTLLSEDRPFDLLAYLSEDPGRLDARMEAVARHGRRTMVAAQSKVFLFSAEPGRDGTRQQKLAAALMAMRGYRSALDALLFDFWADLLGDAYAGPDDPAYQAAKVRIFRMLVALKTAIEDARQANALLADTLRAGVAYPALVVEASLAKAGGGVTVEADGEMFTVTATVVNVSTASVSDVAAVLAPAAPNADITLVDPASQTIGGLQAQSTAVVRWQVRVTAAPDQLTPVVLGVELREGGGPPARFFADDDSLVLAPDLDVLDQDDDGVRDDLGLGAPEADDDQDGLTNRRELLVGTDPKVTDTDGDGLSDGEEQRPGQDGWVTDALRADSDSDGTADGADGAPLDPSSIDPTPAPTPPSIVLDPPVVRLTRDAPVATVEVSNGGGGTLFWTAASFDEGIATVSPAAPSVHRGPGRLTIAYANLADLPGEDEALQVRVAVMDAFGSAEDVTVLDVVAGNGTVPDAGVPSRDAGTTGPGPDGGVATTDAGGTPMAMAPSMTNDGGCGCSAAADGADVRSWGWLLFGLLWAGRRRRRCR